MHCEIGGTQGPLGYVSALGATRLVPWLILVAPSCLRSHNARYIMLKSLNNTFLAWVVILYTQQFSQILDWARNKGSGYILQVQLWLQASITVLWHIYRGSHWHLGRDHHKHISFRTLRWLDLMTFIAFDYINIHISQLCYRSSVKSNTNIGSFFSYQIC